MKTSHIVCTYRTKPIKTITYSWDGKSPIVEMSKNFLYHTTIMDINWSPDTPIMRIGCFKLYRYLYTFQTDTIRAVRMDFSFWWAIVFGSWALRKLEYLKAKIIYKLNKVGLAQTPRGVYAQWRDIKIIGRVLDYAKKIRK